MARQTEQAYPAITGVGMALPKSSVSNEELIAQTGIDSTPEWIVDHTGILQRHWAEEGVYASHLAIDAAHRAMAMAGIAGENLQSIHLSTTSPDHLLPSTASMVHGALGAREACSAVEIRAACAGFVYALQAATDGMLARPDTQAALVAGAELPSRRINTHDRSSVILFGDGGGAVTVEPRQGAMRPVSVMLTQPNLKALYMPAGGTVEAARYPDDPRAKLVMDGRTVKGHAIPIMTRAARLVATQAGIADGNGKIDWSKIDWFVPHQANKRLIEVIGEEIGVPEAQCVVTVDTTANTSSASIPIALASAYNEGHIQGRKRVLFAGVGAGMVGGAVLMDVDLPTRSPDFK